MIFPPRSFLRPATGLILSVLAFAAPVAAAEAPVPGTPTVTLRPPPAVTGANALVLEEVARASRGGGYSVAGGASQRLAAAFTSGGACQPGYSTPSFCSGATYVIFARVAGRLAGSSEADRQRLASALAVNGQVDGVGVWGRWNANGPGTAALFHESRVGYNFTAWDQARPGDFAKLFWNDQIGVKERGHSVIFLGLENGPDGKERVRFWSSNKPDGYGEKSVPLSSVKRVIFSRLHPSPRLEGLSRLPAADPYLASLNRVPTTAEAVSDRVGCTVR